MKDELISAQKEIKYLKSELEIAKKKERLTMKEKQKFEETELIELRKFHEAQLTDLKKAFKEVEKCYDSQKTKIEVTKIYQFNLHIIRNYHIYSICDTYC